MAEPLNINDPAGVILNQVMWRLYVALYGPQEADEITAELEDVLKEVEERLWILEGLRSS